MPKLPTLSFVFFIFSLLLQHTIPEGEIKQNPFTPKASLIRYWNTHISNNLPKPHFLLSKASPLSAVDVALFSNLASRRALPIRRTSFCTAANLVCDFPSSSSSASTAKNPDFTAYSNKKFTTYGASKRGGSDSFANYSLGVNMPVNAFTRYTPGSTNRSERFTNYANDGNVANDTFTSYATSGTGGFGEFTTYESNVNVPNLKFSSYSSNANNHKLTFGSYTQDTNSGTQSFTTYGKNGNAGPTAFTNYAQTSNIVGSVFSSYAELANSANDSFKGYASGGNNPHNNFKNYGLKASSGVERFENYRDQANVGDDTFQTYARGSSSVKASFINYGNSFNDGVDTFKEYGKKGVKRDINFKSYGVNSSFKGYDNNKKGINFVGYRQKGPIDKSGKMVNKLVEEGKFFREAVFKSGTIIKMPDIKDKMPQRSFLPRSITSKLPFSTSSIREMTGIFGVNMSRVMFNALAECQRTPSPGETKRCVASVEDMIDFAVSVLGDNVVVRTTENVNGSGQRVVIGSIRGVNGGNVTKSVSCHQSLFPYLLYYCHSVPKVRVYEADILDLENKAKINRGVAICHLDTSSWSAGHGAFLALGSGPGLIEVCHWIFENDMTWAMAD